MAEKILGGCKCGAVRYQIDVHNLPLTYACHCLDCQTWSGSAFSQQALLPENALSISGPIEIVEFNTSGRISRQRFCPTCQTRIFNTNSARPGLVVLRAGTLDRSNELQAVAHIWVKRKQSWIGLPPDVARWDEGAPAQEFSKRLGLI
jgi:hypothetical protein